MVVDMIANGVYIYTHINISYTIIYNTDMNSDYIPIIAMLLYNCIIFMFDTFYPFFSSVLLDMHDKNLTMRVSIAKVDSEALTIAFCTVHARYIR